MSTEPRMQSQHSEREWLEGLRYEDKFPPCDCAQHCGDDGDIDGPGTCKGLPRAPEPPPVEIVVVPRTNASGRKDQP